MYSTDVMQLCAPCYVLTINHTKTQTHKYVVCHVAFNKKKVACHLNYGDKHKSWCMYVYIYKYDYVQALTMTRISDMQMDTSHYFYFTHTHTCARMCYLNSLW